ncbi:N-glycosylase/DNA lyase isoform X4 [Motacilla alba alba]|uniref:N-glycosylase/DNA lyase isoform X4 n=1 Tax=Motacilla alba alba TaxID=1094192 RepID=UPI0018D504C7|nr:N-glycosylase/DNA lyase isoform X4 [Motacilla alba alba]
MKLRHAPSACPSLWRWLPCPPAELRLDLVLSSGQSFRWWESSPGAWTGVLGGRVWTLRQDGDRLWYTVYGEEEEHEEERDGCPAKAAKLNAAETDRILRDYFQLDVGLSALYRAWGAADPLFRKVASDFPGADAEARLRALGFGYRAKFVSGSARAIAEGLGPEGLCQLRTAPYAEARRVLCALPGVGAKVADCVCLLSLDKAEAVPVDTHVWHIARQRYGVALGGKSLTPRAYQEIGDFFRELWGPRAGWAQAVLFCADLRKGQKPSGSQHQA